MGCDYCTWACPYGAPQYDAESGTMTKCDFCYDRIDAGMPPSCVAACPLRVLDYKKIEEMGPMITGRFLWQLPGTEHPFPLPNYSRTEPHLAIKPHAGMDASLTKAVSNQEELHPPHSMEDMHRPAAIRELPLVGFTLLTQAAAGMAVFSLALSPIPRPTLLAIGILLALGGLISFLHLGRKRNAWRSVVHLKKSWLSREVLLAGLFGAAWAIQAGSQLFWNISPKPWLMAVLGFGLIYSTARIYLLRAVPTWNSWRTPAAFLLTAVTLGALGVQFASPLPGWSILAGIGMMAEMGLMFTARSAGFDTAGRLRIVLLGLGMIGILFTTIVLQANNAWMAISITLVALAAEVIGRWQFYAGRMPFPMRANRA
jgi:DMSO reductase anchor subunit